MRLSGYCGPARLFHSFSELSHGPPQTGLAMRRRGWSAPACILRHAPILVPATTYMTFYHARTCQRRTILTVMHALSAC